MVYQIRIQGALDESWSNWLGNVDIRTEHCGDSVITILTVDLSDQAALFGILDHVRDLNLPLISVHQPGEDLAAGQHSRE